MRGCWLTVFWLIGITARNGSRRMRGAVAAGKVFIPSESINAWLERAWGVVQPDMMLPDTMEPGGEFHDGA